mgnify:FL=1
MGSFGKFSAGVKSGLKSAKFGDIKDIDVLSSYDCGLLRYDSGLKSWSSEPGDIKQRGDLHVTGAFRVLGDLYVTGTTYLQNTVVKHKTQLSSSGASIFGDDYTDTHQFTGSVYVSQHLYVAQNMSGTLALSANALTASYLKVTGSTTLGNHSYNWPTASGNANQVLTIDGSGNLEWATVGDGTDDFITNGDEYVGNRTIGNKTNYTLGVLTNNKQRIHITGEGQGGFIGVGVAGRMEM